ncbi:MAG: 50S ribosomal protein L25 [Parcubacteria group bacterium]|nr:50S ribosomal protein L25 [Parcubacteria group bacterium]MCR4342625.1 50S ribosomal protein L25 [Patescibacteria group bacterium]
MTKLMLNAEKRDVLRKRLKESRLGGKLPAVVYGPKTKPVSIFVSSVDFKKVFNEAGESTVVDLKLDNKPLSVLIHEVSIDPVSREPLHVDFYAALMNKPVEASIFLEFVGISPAVKGLGGMLVKVMHEIEVEALPANLPHSLEVDISVLVNLGDHIIASQIPMPSGVKLITKGDESIVLVEAPREEKVEEVEKTIADIEVEKKGKKEEVEAEVEG